MGETKRGLAALKASIAEQDERITKLKQQERGPSEELQAAQLHISTLENEPKSIAEISKSELSVGIVYNGSESADNREKDQEAVTLNLQMKIHVLQQEPTKNDTTKLNNMASQDILEKLRSDLHFSQKQVQRLEEENQLSRAAFEESCKVLIECGDLQAELKEKDDLLKEAQSLVFDQESTISFLQGNMHKHAQC